MLYGMSAEQRIAEHLAVSERGEVRVGENGMRWRVTTPDSVHSDAADPEMLYAAALASCLHQSVVLEASKEGVPTESSRVRATVTLKLVQEKFTMQAAVAVELPGTDDNTARSIQQRAWQSCPMTRNIDITFEEQPSGA
jgi:osmotically inducible protein OsmC